MCIFFFLSLSAYSSNSYTSCLHPGFLSFGLFPALATAFYFYGDIRQCDGLAHFELCVKNTSFIPHLNIFFPLFLKVESNRFSVASCDPCEKLHFITGW